MQFKSIRWIEVVALSAAIGIVFLYETIGAEETQKPKASSGAFSELKIKKDSSAAKTASESERSTSSEPDKPISDISQAVESQADSLQKVAEPPALDAVTQQQNAGQSDSQPGESIAISEPVSSASSNDAELKPIPIPDDAGPVALEAVSFKGVTPGTTTIDEVEKAWGVPKEIFKQDDMMTQLYSVEPFERVEVSYQHNKVVSVVIRFDKPIPANNIAVQLDMAFIRPVLVSNELGDILGQVYPERGVLFAFESSEDKSKSSSKVTHIILEALNAEPFILRAETELDSRYDMSLRDLEDALNLQPNNARAHWLLSRVLSAMEQFEKAEAASADAVALEPDNPRYRVTRAQILGQMGRLQEAIEEAEKAVETSKNFAHIRARALSLLGDLTASGLKPDYRKAIGYHTKAIEAANTVANDPHPAIRMAAKEVLVDAHLGAVHDIAWGDWKEKEKAVSKWMERASMFADDLVDNEGGSQERQFQVCTRALTACLGMRGKIDPEPWIREAASKGDDLIASSADSFHKAQYQWQLGMALYDAVQIYQMRSDHDKAIKYALSAVEYLEQGHERKQTLSTAYILGRLYFRLGAIQAIRDENHQQAVTWFEKAVPLLLKPLPPEAIADLGRQGESFVSMGVSYWQTKHRKKAVELTEHGIELMEKAVKQGKLDQSALIIPYNNLAAMHRQLGASKDAERYQARAAKIKENKIK
ncbi:MAG TPA: tetratricopeptide repeat protein [Thermoguttaceae bacterium]